MFLLQCNGNFPIFTRLLLSNTIRNDNAAGNLCCKTEKPDKFQICQPNENYEQVEIMLLLLLLLQAENHIY